MGVFPFDHPLPGKVVADVPELYHEAVTMSCIIHIQARKTISSINKKTNSIS